jgi:hypothetical protein
MTKVLVLGAGGQFARHVVAMLDSDADVQLTLFAIRGNRRRRLRTPGSFKRRLVSPQRRALRTYLSNRLMDQEQAFFTTRVAAGT